LGRAAEERDLLIVDDFLLIMIASDIVIIQIKLHVLLCHTLDNSRHLLLLVVSERGSTLYVLEGVLHDCDTVIGIETIDRRCGAHAQHSRVVSSVLDFSGGSQVILFFWAFGWIKNAVMLALGNYLLLYLLDVKGFLISLLPNVFDDSPVVVKFFTVEFAELPHFILALYLGKVSTDTVSDFKAT
jgi:hypothetical protein